MLQDVWHLGKTEAQDDSPAGLEDLTPLLCCQLIPQPLSACGQGQVIERKIPAQPPET